MLSHGKTGIDSGRWAYATLPKPLDLEVSDFTTARSWSPILVIRSSVGGHDGNASSTCRTWTSDSRRTLKPCSSRWSLAVSSSSSIEAEAADQLAIDVELGKPRRIELAQRRIGRRHQPAIGEAHADVARGAGAQPARGELDAERTDRLARLVFLAHSPAKALVKKSGAPKL